MAQPSSPGAVKQDLESGMSHPKDPPDDRTGRASHIQFGNAVPPEERTGGIYHSRVNRHRSLSRDSIRSSHHNASQPNKTAGIPIEFRTLSFQISESQNATQEVVKERQAKETPDQDYFESLDYHILSPDRLAQQLNVDVRSGLSASAAASRLQRDGPNVIAHHRENYLKKILWYVFGGFCSVLWVGVIIFFLCWKPLSDPPSITNLAMAILVLIVIFLQASFSAFQDWSTKHVMNSILNLLPSEALVLRDGKQVRVPSTDLVAGDVVHISIGNKVPADMRLIHTSGDVRFDRAILTGESDEIEGAIDSTDGNFLETRNIAFMGTSVVNGNAVGMVVLTGSRSVMGRIAKMTTGVKEKPTLIQKEITRFVTIIIGLTLTLVLAILFTWVGWLRVDHFDFMNVVAMLNNIMGCVVAFIPEGMPVAVALTLMMVARRMKASNILPKGLATVETLGCVNVICSDKTGTLTQNKMFVRSLGLVDRELSIDQLQENPSTTTTDPAALTLSNLLRGSFLCNDASFDPATITLPIHERNVTGNATDAAVLRFAEQAQPITTTTTTTGPSPYAAYERIHQIPFNSKNKWMLTMHKDPSRSDSSYLTYVKGAPDVLLPRCTTYVSGIDHRVKALDESAQQLFSDFQATLSRRAERVIVLCQRHYTPTAAVGSNDFTDEILAHGVQDLTVIGIFGIVDLPRPETAATVAACRGAGIRFFMVTGDFGLTAAAIARDVGIFTGTAAPDTIEDLHRQCVAVRGSEEDDEKQQQQQQPLSSRHSLLLDGRDLSALTDEHWDTIHEYSEIVFARTSPEHKFRIVEEFKARGSVVAVTGDGVNDAPALRTADVGIAVVSGSDVAIEAADLVLLARFDSIVDAIRLGRLVFQNLQKVIAYLLPAGSWSEIWPVLLNVFFGVPLPLSSFLMIVICVFTDLFCALALIAEKEEFDLLRLPPRNTRRNPRRPNHTHNHTHDRIDHLINRRIYTQSYLFIGILETLAAHAMYFLYMSRAAHIPPRSLFFAFESYAAGFHGHDAAQLTHFLNTAQSVYFVTLVLLQWGNILAVRNRRLSIVTADPLRRERRNLYLFAAMGVSLAIAVFVTEVEGVRRVFGTARVPVEYWFFPLPMAVGILGVDELRKFVVRVFPGGWVERISW